MKLIENLYAYVWNGRDNNCNTYVLGEALIDGKHLVIDPGHITTPSYHEAGLDRLLSAMQQDGIGTSIGMVILTHAHPDHAEAAAVIRETHNALVALHADDEPMYRMLGGQADLHLEEGALELGDKPINLQVFHSPGHSRGHLALYWPGQKVLIAGDLIFYRSTGRVDLPGGNAGDLKRSIKRLSQLDVEYLLCGHPYGHPGIIKGRDAVKENFEFIEANIL